MGVRVGVAVEVDVGVGDGVGTEVGVGVGSGPVQARTKASTARLMSRNSLWVIASQYSSCSKARSGSPDGVRTRDIGVRRSRFNHVDPIGVLLLNIRCSGLLRLV